MFFKCFVPLQPQMSTDFTGSLCDRTAQQKKQSPTLKWKIKNTCVLKVFHKEKQHMYL